MTPLLALALSAAMHGIDGYIVRVEADSSPGTPAFAIIGLPDRALGESRERVRSAIFNCGFAFPAGRLLINLSPADIRKEGPAFDLPIALALIAIDEQVDRLALQEFVTLGELALDGSVRAVRGILPMVLGGAQRRADADDRTARQRARSGAGRRARAVRGRVAVRRGRDRPRPRRQVPSSRLHATLSGRTRRPTATSPTCAAKPRPSARSRSPRPADTTCCLIGPPGCGKTMLARRLPSMLPPMSTAEALEVTKIYSVAGLLGADAGIVATRPFRAPHHTISQVALAGGGGVPKPGEISLAHHGVLFLDEVAEFGRTALETMRQPLEEGVVTIGRAAGTFAYPARFALIASMNPCPCGFRGTRTSDCRCDDATVARYVGKLSGPLLDRIDVHVEVTRVGFDEMLARAAGEPSAAIRGRVEAARDRTNRALS